MGEKSVFTTGSFRDFQQCQGNCVVLSAMNGFNCQWQAPEKG